MLFTAGIDLMESTKTLGLVIALTLLLLFRIFLLVFMKPFLAIKEQFVYC